jgi:hypothetical protein
MHSEGAVDPEPNTISGIRRRQARDKFVKRLTQRRQAESIGARDG